MRPLVLFSALILGCLPPPLGGGDAESGSFVDDAGVADAGLSIRDAGPPIPDAGVFPLIDGGIMAPFDGGLGTRLAAHLAETHRRLSALGATLGVLAPDGSRWSGAAGFESPMVPMRSASRLRIASLTKIFTAVMILQLVDEGRLSLEDPLATWFPMMPRGNEVTIRNLLSHSSGIADYVRTTAYLNRQAQVWTPDELLSLVVTQPLAFTPGTRAQYSNSNTLFLGRIVERVTGAPYAAVVRARLLVPLALHDTFVDGDEVVMGLAPGYSSTGENVTGLTHPSGAWAAGAIVSTVDDLMTFAWALTRGQLLSQRLLTELQTAQRLSSGMTSAFGLGLQVQPTSVGPLDFHTGSYPGYDAAFLHFRIPNWIVIALVNRTGRQEATELGWTAFEVIAGQVVD